MPYKDPNKNREYQRKWTEQKRRAKGIPPRQFIPEEKRGEHRREREKEYWRKHPIKKSEKNMTARKNLKLRVYDYLGGAICVRCGCTDSRILEINHIYGGGAKEIKRLGSGSQIQRSILKDKRKDEFEVLCRVCNAAHYCELRFGLKHEITYKGMDS
jgi:hypothetical protein